MEAKMYIQKVCKWEKEESVNAGSSEVVSELSASRQRGTIWRTGLSQCQPMHSRKMSYSNPLPILLLYSSPQNGHLTMCKQACEEVLGFLQQDPPVDHQTFDVQVVYNNLPTLEYYVTEIGSNAILIYSPSFIDLHLFSSMKIAIQTGVCLEEEEFEYLYGCCWNEVGDTCINEDSSTQNYLVILIGTSCDQP